MNEKLIVCRTNENRKSSSFSSSGDFVDSRTYTAHNLPRLSATRDEFLASSPSGVIDYKVFFSPKTSNQRAGFFVTFFFFFLIKPHE